jgi:hypothetical protein
VNIKNRLKVLTVEDSCPPKNGGGRQGSSNLQESGLPLVCDFIKAKKYWEIKNDIMEK